MHTEQLIPTHGEILHHEETQQIFAFEMTNDFLAILLLYLMGQSNMAVRLSVRVNLMLVRISAFKKYTLTRYRDRKDGEICYRNISFSKLLHKTVYFKKGKNILQNATKKEQNSNL